VHLLEEGGLLGRSTTERRPEKTAGDNEQKKGGFGKGKGARKKRAGASPLGKDYLGQGKSRKERKRREGRAEPFFFVLKDEGGGIQKKKTLPPFMRRGKRARKETHATKKKPLSPLTRKETPER